MVSWQCFWSGEKQEYPGAAIKKCHEMYLEIASDLIRTFELVVAANLTSSLDVGILLRAIHNATQAMHCLEGAVSLTRAKAVAKFSSSLAHNNEDRKKRNCLTIMESQNISGWAQI